MPRVIGETSTEFVALCGPMQSKRKPFARVCHKATPLPFTEKLSQQRDFHCGQIHFDSSPTGNPSDQQKQLIFKPIVNLERKVNNFLPNFKRVKTHSSCPTGSLKKLHGIIIRLKLSRINDHFASRRGNGLMCLKSVVECRIHSFFRTSSRTRRARKEHASHLNLIQFNLMITNHDAALL